MGETTKPQNVFDFKKICFYSPSDAEKYADFNIFNGRPNIIFEIRQKLAEIS